MTRYYLEVLQEGLSICVDCGSNGFIIDHHHHFDIGDIITINMYSDKGLCHGSVPKVVFETIEYDAIFTLDWKEDVSSRWSVAGCITKGYLRDMTIQIMRQKKLEQLL